MSDWFMLTVVGKDRPGIVAEVTAVLFRGGCNLGEASMIRLGGNFTIMLMARYAGDRGALESMLQAVAEPRGLCVHVDPIEGALHRHVDPEVRITVYGADRAGIVARVTGALAEAGLNITGLESDVGGTPGKPIYIMQLEGVAAQGVEALESALALVAEELEVEVRLDRIESLLA